MEVVASLSQCRTAAAQCGLFTYKSVPVIFEPPCKPICTILGNPRLTEYTQTPSAYSGASSSSCYTYHVARIIARILAAIGCSRSEALGLRAWKDAKLCISFYFSVYFLFEHQCSCCYLLLELISVSLSCHTLLSQIMKKS